MTCRLVMIAITDLLVTCRALLFHCGIFCKETNSRIQILPRLNYRRQRDISSSLFIREPPDVFCFLCWIELIDQGFWCYIQRNADPHAVHESPLDESSHQSHDSHGARIVAVVQQGSLCCCAFGQCSIGDNDRKRGNNPGRSASPFWRSRREI